MADRDTTAQELIWQFYCPMANLRAMNNVLQEIDSILGESEDTTKYEVLMHELPYLKAVLHEALRLHHLVPKNVKQVLVDDAFPMALVSTRADSLATRTESRSPFGKHKGKSQSKFISFNAGPRLWSGTSICALRGHGDEMNFTAEVQFQFDAEPSGPGCEGIGHFADEVADGLNG
ncbi:hypothetical protein BC939DRAFT_502116 [Gamsiella multidivaricata]|uniref:uncharacterized protein n=1 Tax=Gamsiella multidivaricata TaxID=101098 RepID=UPI00221F0A09|nr:uncharacterized protein BC939DRAFT_502116 [Gamsiella multidivaricata]KAI7825666.1 hypothetical protein BC939DRAFT_502116 [Gamsiella multidivaricata]